jgi:hypothetical protein
MKPTYQSVISIHPDELDNPRVGMRDALARGQRVMLDPTMSRHCVGVRRLTDVVTDPETGYLHVPNATAGIWEEQTA